MVNIDYIMNLFDWNNSDENQNRGLELAKNVKCISVFIQPGSPYGKNVWDNCAKALARKDDKELEPHLIALLEWLQDMNWPGAFCIQDRLQKYKDVNSLDLCLSICLKKAKKLGDETWEYNLNILKQSMDVSKPLKKTVDGYMSSSE